VSTQLVQKSYKVIDFVSYLAKPEEVQQLLTWQRPSENIPKTIPYLQDVLQFDDDGEIVTSETGCRKALSNHLNSL